MTRSWGSVNRVKMYTPTIILLCGILGRAVAYYNQVPYNIGPNDPYPILNNYNIPQEPSQRLFWSNGQGSNQVGGTGFWAMLTNKFPFLGNMFGRMELPSQYGAPNQFNLPQQYNSLPQYTSNVAQRYNAPLQYSAPDQQYFRQSQIYRQDLRQFSPSSRDVAITDDAVIITPPQTPIFPQPAPAPAPAPVPQPSPVPSPQPSPGYHYNKPQYRLELPHK